MLVKIELFHQIYCVMRINKEMPEALDNGSQPYRNALGCFEMAGESDTTHIQPCLVGKGHTLLMSPTQGQAYIIGGNPIPAISQPLKG